MKNFNFYFESSKNKKINYNQEKNQLEINLDDYYGQGLLFSQQEFQQTNFQTLILPATPQVKKVLLTNDISEKRMVIKEVRGEPEFTIIDEKTIKLTTSNFGTVEMVEAKNENPFDPLTIEWGRDGFFFHPQRKPGWKSWQMWWNPRNMKFWDPPLTPAEQANFLKDKESNRWVARWQAWEIHKNRINRQNRKIDLYFLVNKTDNYHSRSSNPDRKWSDEWEIRIFCWPPFATPAAIEELVPNESERRKEVLNSVIGEIKLIFEKNMKLFHQWNNLLKKCSSNERFVIRNIPFQINERNFYSLDNLRDFDEYDWQLLNKKSKLENEPPQWREHKRNSILNRQAFIKEKLVQTMVIHTKGLEDKLKLEEVSFAEYQKHSGDLSSKEKKKLKRNIENNNDFARNFLIISGIVVVSVIILFFIIRNKRKKIYVK